MAFNNSNVPTAPKGCEFRDDYLSYTKSGFSWAACIFLIAFSSIWSFVIGTACIAILFDGTEAPLFAYLFLTPFVIVDFVLWAMLIYVFFGKEVGWLDETGFHREFRCLFFRLRKDVPLSSIRKFKLGRDYSIKQNHQPAICVQIVTSEKDINVMRSFTETDNQHWLVAAGNAILMNLNDWEPVQESSASADSLSSEGFVDPSVFDEDDADSTDSVSRFQDEELDDWNEDEIFEGKTERFDSSDHVPDADKPVGTSWKMTADFDTIEFKRRGRWTAGLFGSLFFAAFWNGIVSVFVCALWGVIGAEDNAPSTPDSAAVQTADNSEDDQSVVKNDKGLFESLKDKHMIVNDKPAPFFGREWWFMFCFLIPFEIIGLAMIWAFLSQLFAPFTTQSWTFNSNKAVRKRTLFGFPFIRRFDMMDFSYLEIHHYQYQPRANKDELTFYDRNDKKILTIKNLNRAEARWIANEVLTML
ncbi:MAG: hypothetical protein IJF84_09395 [Thermoguttaceae bacterium]|nr:hypothetical protein [Thermoguttaceae bacterium]